MLVLSRRNKQSIKIGDDIVVTILDVKGKRITVGIDAPDDVQIRRAELPAPAKVETDTCPNPGASLEACATTVPISDLTTMLLSE